MGGKGTGWGRWSQKLKQKRKKTQIAEFRVAIYDVYMHPQRTNIPLQGLDRCELTVLVGAIPGPHNKLKPSFGAIPPVVDLHGQQKTLRKSRSFDISQ